MKVLVLGGTQFIGRHVLRNLLRRGHSVTLLNRGKTGPGLYPEIPLIRVDRESDELRNEPMLRQEWDAVIDLSAYYPKDVASLLGVLNGRAGRYVLCSTMSAYVALKVEGPTPLVNEDAELRTCTPTEAMDRTLASYGQRKAECERVAMAQHSTGTPVVILRPCVVFGEFDPTDRVAYWLWRASRRERYILPDGGLTIIRRTYAPDLAEAFSSAIESRIALGKAYNIAETDPLSLRDTVHHVGRHLGIPSLDYSVSVDSDLLLKQEVKPWLDFPMWLPKLNLLVDTFRSRRDFGFESTSPAVALAEATDAFLAEKRAPVAGMSFQKESELLSQLSIR